MEDYRLIIDTRERDIFAHLDRAVAYNGLFSEVKQLARSDYAITKGDRVLAVIERKSLKDLAASIKDGRLGNLDGLVEMRDEGRCDVWLLIEGSPFNNPQRKFGRIPWSTLKSCILDASIRRGIYVVYSKNASETGNELCDLMRRYIRADERGDLPAVGGMEMLNTRREVTDAEYVGRMWSAVSGITAQTGHEMAKLGSFADLKALSKEGLRARIESVRYSSGRRLATKTVNAACDLIRGNCDAATSQRFLEQVPRLSRAVASLVVRRHTPSALMTFEKPAIAMIKPEEAKKKLGKVGEKLYELLHHRVVEPADESDDDSEDSSSDDSESESDSD